MDSHGGAVLAAESPDEPSHQRNAQNHRDVEKLVAEA